MTNATVHKYATDLLAAHHHVAEAIARQVTDERVLKMSDASGVLYEVHGTVQRHFHDLEAQLRNSGGLGAAGQMKEALTSVSGFLAGLYGQLRGEPVSRMIRDDLSAVHFLHTCTSMFHTTARACGDTTFAACAEAMFKDHAVLLMRLSDVLPRVVLRELPPGETVDSSAAEVTIRANSEAWHSAAAASGA